MDDALEDLMKDSMTEYSGRIHRMDLVLGSLQKMESLSVPEGGYEKFQKRSKQKQQKSITLNQKRTNTTRVPYLSGLDLLFQLVF